MDKTPSPSNLQETEGFIKGLIQHVRLVWRLLKDSRVPSWIKLVPLAGLLYVLSPIDLIPDLMLPGLGELDDLAIVILSLKSFIELSPPAIVRQHLDELAGRRASAGTTVPRASNSTIDVAYRVLGAQERRTKEKLDD